MMNPITLKRWQRFRSIRRGYYAAILLVLTILLSLFAECLVNHRALLVHYQGHWYFPTYGKMIPGNVLGQGHEYETNYRDLQKSFRGSNWVLMPPVPWGPFENDLRPGEYPPAAPNWQEKHFLGTDTTGRDVLARLIYGLRMTLLFSVILLLCNYSVGITVGSLMGYFGGKFDLFFQRIIEIWANIPFLYVVIIVSSMMVPNMLMLVAIMVFFGWMSITWYMRTAVYREKARDYVKAARALGASKRRIIFHHILPNSLSIIVTLAPFSIASGITSLTALDYLGFGLRAPTPSWGELLAQGTSNMYAYWISFSVIISMVVLLLMVTFIGEALREAFDPKRHTTYE